MNSKQDQNQIKQQNCFLNSTPRNVNKERWKDFERWICFLGKRELFHGVPPAILGSVFFFCQARQAHVSHRGYTLEDSAISLIGSSRHGINLKPTAITMLLTLSIFSHLGKMISSWILFPVQFLRSGLVIMILPMKADSSGIARQQTVTGITPTGLEDSQMVTPSSPLNMIVFPCKLLDCLDPAICMETQSRSRDWKV